MSDTFLHKKAGKAVIIHPPSLRALILRLGAADREARSTPDRAYDEWHVPGGSIEDSDNGSTAEAARRETFEETGLLVEVVQPLGSATWQAIYEGQPAAIEADFYLCTIVSKDSEPPEVELSAESSASAWVTQAELAAYISQGLTEEAYRYITAGLTILKEADRG